VSRLCQQELPSVHLIFAGFSFGSYVAYRTAAQCDSSLLVTIAPPVHHFDYTEFSPAPNPWVIFQGNDDEVAPLQSVLDFLADNSYPIVLEQFSETGHFFHGQLIALKTRLIETIHQQLELA
jgi:alpha/beta superfamily hydrolase